MADIGIKLTAQDQTQGAFSSVGKSLATLQSGAASASASLASLGVGISVGGFVAFTKAAIDSLDALNDIKDATGASIENISALEDVARRTGTSFDTVGSALIKLNQTLNSAKVDSDAAKAIEKIGLSVKDLKQLDPAEAFRQIAVGLNKFADDGNKARIAQELFGKSLKEIAPLLKDVAEAGALVGTVTAEQAQEAENLNKQLFKLQANSLATSRSIANEFLPTLNTIAKEFLNASNGASGWASVLGDTLKTALEAFAIVGANVSFVLKGIGREIGALYAQQAAVLRLDFKGFTAISDAVKEDGIRARKELDALEKRILNPKLNDTSAGGGRGIGYGSFAPSIGSIPDAPTKTKAISEYQKLNDEISKQIALSQAELDIGRKLTDSEKYRVDILGKIKDAFREGKISADEYAKVNKLALKAAEEKEKTEELTKAIKRNIEAYKESLEFQNEINAAYVADSKAREQGRLAVDAYVDSINEQNTLTALELSLVGQTSAAREIALAQYRIELDLKKQIKAIDENSGFDEAQREEQRAKARLAAATAGATASTKVYVSEWKKASDQIENSLTDALLRGFESGKGFIENLRDTIVNTFKTMVLKPIISAVVNPVAGAAASALGFSGAANAGTAASGLTSLSSLATLGSAFGSSLSAGFSATVSSFGAATGVAIEGGLASIATGTSSAIAGGLGQIAGALGPYALAAVAIAGLLGAFKGEYVKGAGSATLGFDASGAVTSKNAFTNSFDVQSAAADNFVKSLLTSYTKAAESLGIKSAGGAFAFGSNNSDGGKFGVNVAVGNSTYATTDIKITEESLKLEASRAVFAALQGSELPGYLSKVFDGITASTATEEQINQTLAYAQSLKSVRDALTETRDPLQILQDNVADGLKALGTTAESFKTDFVAAIDGGIDPNTLAKFQKLGAGLEELSKQSGSASVSVSKLAETNARLQDKLDLLTGEQTTRSLELRDATDESTRALLKQIYAQEDLNAAAEEAAKSVADVAGALGTWAQQTADALAYFDSLNAQAADLNDRLAVATGSKTQRQVDLQRELANAMGEANKELVKQVFAAEDLAAARTEVQGIRDQATAKYLQAQQAVTQAQQNLASVLQSTVKSFQDFLGTLDGGQTPTVQLAGARKNFQDLSLRAQGGDTAAIGQLTTSARTLLDLSKGYSSSIQDYRRDEAKVRAILQQGIAAGQEQLLKLPQSVQDASDPLKSAYQALAKATKDEQDARTLALAVQASLTDTEKTLGDKYLEAIAALPEGETLAKFYADTFDAAAAAKQIAQDSATAAQRILATIGNNSVATTPAATPGAVAAGGATVGNFGMIRVDGAQGTQLFWAKDLAMQLNAYADANGSIAATARAVELGATPAILEEIRKYSEGIPRFAKGANYIPSEMLAVLHPGEAVIPAAFNPEQYSRASGNTALVIEIQALRAEVKQLREDNTRENNALIAPTQKTAKTLDKWDIDGNAPVRA